ncbi:hypothetical protein [Jiella avicenniae]|uniref:Uncharacterized protein n=1 Tax=Jiella avicenniae TaxID=2907202 RepID=A0A9X1TB74_9HYPH|nr:hypothetical protein [Jiella avicenniae]MCE7027868.1 hypothetical protein [Jiella avicenniae]
MEPSLLNAASASLNKTVPTLARAMQSWLESENGGKITVNSEDKVQISEITPDNVSDVINIIKNGILSGVFQPQADNKEPGRTFDHDTEILKIALIEATLNRMQSRLTVELPRARSRVKTAKRLKLSASLVALVSNVSVLGALGLGNSSASVVAAIIALLVSGFKIVEDHLIAGFTGNEPHKLQEFLIETNRLLLECDNVSRIFATLNQANASPNAYPIQDAERICKDLMRIIPEIELKGD